ncbi:hypothetical protein LI291_08375 [Intestinibacillus massiliensis]|nr:hypothetical protein [Intestinibacillus massiliensis]
MYRPYRGQRAQRHRRIRNCILVLLALLVVAGAVFLLFFQDRMVYSSDGVHFDLPWGKAGTQDDGNVDVPLDIEGGGEGQDTPPDGGAAPAPLAVSATPKLLEVPVGRLGDEAYLGQVKALHAQGAINGVAIVVKDAAGNLAWGGTPDTLAAAVQAFQADGLPVTAVLYAYQDDARAAADETAALHRTNGNVWRAADNTRYLDPGADAANAYLSGLVQQLSGMGFQEAVLRAYGWPAEGAGRLDRIRYGGYADPAARSAKLAETLEALKAAAGGMELSVCIDNPTAENGFDQPSGQDLAALTPGAARIYVPMVVQTATSGDSIRTIVGRVQGADTAKLVPMYDSAELAASLFAGSQPVYFSPSATDGEIAAYVAP